VLVIQSFVVALPERFVPPKLPVVNIGPPLPSENTESVSPQPRYFYGMPMAGIIPIPPSQQRAVEHKPLTLPDCNNPRWDEYMYTKNKIKPALDFLIPPPAVEPPLGCFYPQASIYHLRQTDRYTRGYAYVHNWFTESSFIDQKNLTKVVMPPSVHPTLVDDDTWMYHPVPGNLVLEEGISYAVCVNGNPDMLITECGVHTESSIMQYEWGPTTRKRLRHMWEVSFGLQDGNNGGPNSPAVFNINGLKRNDRSAPQVGMSRDGSFNMASTVMKGNGQGIFMPAVQASYPEAINMIALMREDIVAIYAAVMPTMMSLQEWQAIVFHATDNNTFGFGGLGPNPTSLQMNVSSVTDALALSLSIGKLQGALHVDFGDDPTRLTLFIIFFNLPEGKHWIKLVTYSVLTLDIGIFFRKRSRTLHLCPLWSPHTCGAYCMVPLSCLPRE
jgi:hypothetical protein